MKLTKEQITALANQLEQDQIKEEQDRQNSLLKHPKYVKALKELESQWKKLHRVFRARIENEYHFYYKENMHKAALKISGLDKKQKKIDQKSSWDWQREIQIASIDSDTMEQLMKKLGR